MDDMGTEPAPETYVATKPTTTLDEMREQLQARLKFLKGVLDKAVGIREEANNTIRLTRAEIAQGERLLRATEPRKAKAAK